MCAEANRFDAVLDGRSDQPPALSVAARVAARRAGGGFVEAASRSVRDQLRLPGQGTWNWPPLDRWPWSVNVLLATLSV